MKRLVIALMFVLSVLCAAPTPVQAACGWFPGKFIGGFVANRVEGVRQRSQARQARRQGTAACAPAK